MTWSQWLVKCAVICGMMNLAINLIMQYSSVLRGDVVWRNFRGDKMRSWLISDNKNVFKSIKVKIQYKLLVTNNNLDIMYACRLVVITFVNWFWAVAAKQHIIEFILRVSQLLLGYILASIFPNLQFCAPILTYVYILHIVCVWPCAYI